MLVSGVQQSDCYIFSDYIIFFWLYYIPVLNSKFLFIYLYSMYSLYIFNFNIKACLNSLQGLR